MTIIKKDLRGHLLYLANKNYSYKYHANKRFPLSTDDVRTTAFNFAERLNLTDSTEPQKKLVTIGRKYFWKEALIFQYENLKQFSLARSQDLNKVEVDAQFQLMELVLTDNDLIRTTNCIFHMCESSLQLNNRRGHVLVEK